MHPEMQLKRGILQQESYGFPTRFTRTDFAKFDDKAIEAGHFDARIFLM